MTMPEDDFTLDHEALAGPVIEDPWDDDTQEDWPTQSVIVDPLPEEGNIA